MAPLGRDLRGANEIAPLHMITYRAELFSVYWTATAVTAAFTQCNTLLLVATMSLAIDYTTENDRQTDRHEPYTVQH